MGCSFLERLVNDVVAVKEWIRLPFRQILRSDRIKKIYRVHGMQLAIAMLL